MLGRPARRRIDNGHPPPRQPVQQAAFADVRPADDRHLEQLHGRDCRAAAHTAPRESRRRRIRLPPQPRDHLAYINRPGPEPLLAQAAPDPAVPLPHAPIADAPPGEAPTPAVDPPKAAAAAPVVPPAGKRPKMLRQFELIDKVRSYDPTADEALLRVRTKVKGAAR